MNDEYDLGRFIRAQAPIYDHAIAGLNRGKMPAQYMDLVFPRLCSGSEDAVQAYAIASLDEARAYLSVPTLGGRYRECISILQRLSNLSVTIVFGECGAEQLHESLTLFSEANRHEFLLETMFDVWFDGLNHEDTIRRLMA